MKKLITVLMFLTTIFGYSQKIVENEIDEFTKNRIIRSDWEKVSSTSNLYLNTRISKINDTHYLELKFYPKGVSSISVEDNISFMFESGEVINLHSDKYKISNYGDGSIGIVGSKAIGFNIDCVLNSNDLEKFKNNIVKKIRINKSEGYSEEELKSKNSEKFRQLFNLF